jgi:hypothetical protein
MVTTHLRCDYFVFAPVFLLTRIDWSRKFRGLYLASHQMKYLNFIETYLGFSPDGGDARQKSLSLRCLSFSL